MARPARLALDGRKDSAAADARGRAQRERGPRRGVVERLGRAFAPARLLDIHADPDHGRSGLHPRGAAGRAGRRPASRGRARRSRRSTCAHAGPAPARGRARRAARRLPRRRPSAGPACAEVLAAAGRIGAELEVPVVLYGELATRPEHPERAELRRGARRALAERIEAGEVCRTSGPAARIPPPGCPGRGPPAAGGLQRGPRERRRGAGRADRGARSASPAAGCPACARSACFLADAGSRAGVDQRARLPRHPAARRGGGGPRARRGRRGRAGRAGARGRLRGFPEDVPLRGFSPERHLLENALRSVTLMAQTKKKRRRKHRGTPAGTIERAPGAPGARAVKQDAKKIARQRRAERLEQGAHLAGLGQPRGHRRGGLRRAPVVVLAPAAAGGRLARRVHVPALHPARATTPTARLQLPPAQAQK